MKKQVFVTRMAALTALGNLDDLWLALCSGRTAAAPVTRFDTSRLGCHTAACWPNFDDRPPGGLWRMMETTLNEIGQVPENTYVIWTGIKGSAEFIEGTFQRRRNTEMFLPVHFRQAICDRLGLRNDGLEMNAACTAFTSGLLLAADMISSGVRENILVCAADIVSWFTFTGFAALKAMTPGICRPFDKNRDGMLIGDGASAFLLSSSTDADRRGLDPLAEIKGWGATNDANHITGPARDGSGLQAAIRNALEKGKINPGEVDAVCAHGTGTIYNDKMEMMTFEHIFGDRPVPTFSIKGAIGHTMGAAGGIESAVAIRSLQEKIIPPTVGLKEPDAGARGKVSSACQQIRGKKILKTSSGFGGLNAVVVLQTT
jgi:3-oxoacyl-[acyl-carrier-protein] synthase II